MNFNIGDKVRIADLSSVKGITLRKKNTSDMVVKITDAYLSQAEMEWYYMVRPI